MPTIHPLAAVDPNARLAEDVEVGPFCVVGPDVTLGPGNRLLNNVTVMGVTTVGRGNVFFPNCVIGAPPQDKKYAGAKTRLEIGDHNQVREAVTIHTGTEKGGGLTRIGSGNLLMVNAHLGHDAMFGDNNIVANNVMIAGHVVCGHHVVLSGGVGVHHFVTIGDYAFVGGYARISRDVPPYCRVDVANEVRGINTTGLERATAGTDRARAFSADDIESLEDACRRLFYSDQPMAAAMAEFHLNNGINPHVKRLIEFLDRRNRGKNGRYLESLRAK